MNRSIVNVIFGGYGTSSTGSNLHFHRIINLGSGPAQKVQGSYTPVNIEEAVDMIVNSKSVIIVPGRARRKNSK